MLVIGAVAFGVAFLLRTFLFQPFLVHGASMEPTFADGEYLLIDEISYSFRSPERGEVVVFRFPQNESQFFIKRIIGLPGETVQIRGGAVWIVNGSNPAGMRLVELYSRSPESGGETTIILGDGEYFVLGDNRTVSYDSRRWGPVPRRDIVGRVWVRAWPVNRATVFSAPTYRP
ncbi:signal peptidase I [Candidatus Parcubacteria bacterium]|nr:signal peptidase I [Candidatus Parcubacteria bacterium]MBI4099016.1 signal peptidase I [Candidatus Parcubacteria bacterium]MBI4385306.1 signal peptidase I [Candidatus Parcubacteria bacterium]